MRANNGGIFNPYNSNPEERIIRNMSELKKKIDAVRALGHKVVLTMGTFDLAHIGHYRYFETARSHGDFLIVGVDSDKKTRKRKGPHRPVVNEDERMEILCHSRHIDLVVLKKENFQKWQIIKTIKPDVLIATEGNYTDQEVVELEEKYCGKVEVLEPQATTTTTAKVRKIMVEGLDTFKKEVSNRIPKVLDDSLEATLNKK